MIPVDDETPRGEPKVNPYLIPVHAGSAENVYDPIRLVDAVLELKHASYSICAAVFHAGYAYPKQDIVEKRSRFESTDEGMEVTFPPPGPVPGDPIVVLDHHYQGREVPHYWGITKGAVYFDIDTGQWVAFTPRHDRTYTTRPYQSLAAKYPVPTEEPSA